MDYEEPQLTSNEKLQPIQWTEQPTAASVAMGSVWPSTCIYINKDGNPSTISTRHVKSKYKHRRENQKQS
jgi:hypothetical protein